MLAQLQKISRKREFSRFLPRTDCVLSYLYLTFPFSTFYLLAYLHAPNSAFLRLSSLAVSVTEQKDEASQSCDIAE